METSNTYRADNRPAVGGHHMVDGLMRCDACWGVCLPQFRCRCCLTADLATLRAQIQAVRDVCSRDSFVADFDGLQPTVVEVEDILRALDGADNA